MFPLIFNRGVGWCWVVRSTPLPLHPSERHIVPTVLEAWWATGLVWKDMVKGKAVTLQA